MNNKKLKPCPFCGCEEVGTKWHGGYWSIQCGYSHNPIPSEYWTEYCFQDWGEFGTEEQAIEAWNKRVSK